MLRCTCGAAMIPRKARKGSERARYVCGGRIANGPDYACSQPSIRRELIDGPFLSALLDRYVDLDATRQRIAERKGEALALAREAAEQAEVELHRAEQRIIRVRRGWQDGVIDDAEYAEQTAELQREREAAHEALQALLARVAGIRRPGQPTTPSRSFSTAWRTSSARSARARARHRIPPPCAT